MFTAYQDMLHFHVFFRSLDGLGANFIGFERSDSVNNAVMNFEPKHQFLELALSKAMLSYSPNQWTTIGPSMMTKMIRNCNISISVRKTKLYSAQLTWCMRETL